MTNRQVSQKPTIELIPVQNYLKENDKIIFDKGETEKKVKIKFKITDDKPIPAYIKEGFSMSAYIIYDLSNSGNLIQNPKVLDCPYEKDSGQKIIVCEDEFSIKNNVGPKLRLSIFAQDSDKNTVEKRVGIEVEKGDTKDTTIRLELLDNEVSLSREFFEADIYLDNLADESKCFSLMYLPLIFRELCKIQFF